MSVWQSRSVLEVVTGALGETHLSSSAHTFGVPFLTAYQLAIKVHAAEPGIANDLDVEVGGRGVGKRSSLAQYLARELSRRIARAAAAGESYPVEGAFVSNEHLQALTYRTAGGDEVVSSLTATGFDLSLFRLRASS